MKVALVGCGKDKLTTAAPAQDLYTSQLFQKRRQYAERFCDLWFILSAFHDLVKPDKWLFPYDRSMKELDRAARNRFGIVVSEDLVHHFRQVPDRKLVTIEIHAGQDYAKEISWRLHNAGFDVRQPMLRLSIGLQLQWYAQQLAAEPA